ncbi:hypothetical protein XENORESO_017781 [Xenotaenia resolanae]|uniref:Uncharacterized protein n=1 Tax=Xenotaenia resolanae TaxID=208358 RepID=A0ABV0WFM9_9TELE
MQLHHEGLNNPALLRQKVFLSVKSIDVKPAMMLLKIQKKCRNLWGVSESSRCLHQRHLENFRAQAVKYFPTAFPSSDNIQVEKEIILHFHPRNASMLTPLSFPGVPEKVTSNSGF